MIWLQQRVHCFIRETANTALRLARYFKMSPQFWLGLQMDYELDLAKEQFESEIAEDIKPMAASC